MNKIFWCCDFVLIFLFSNRKKIKIYFLIKSWIIIVSFHLNFYLYLNEYFFIIFFRNHYSINGNLLLRNKYFNKFYSRTSIIETLSRKELKKKRDSKILLQGLIFARLFPLTNCIIKFARIIKEIDNKSK